MRGGASDGEPVERDLNVSLVTGGPGDVDEEVQGQRGGGHGCGESSEQGHPETRGESFGLF